MTIALSELLSRRELGLHVLHQGADPERIAIEYAEICELPDPRPWIGNGTMLLATGVALGHGAHTQRLFVERAAEAGVSVIGFAVGLAHAQVPDGVVEACARLDVTLLSVPPGTPFRILVEAVAERSAPLQLQVAQRVLSIQNYLMEAVSAPEPEAEVLRRLGSLLSGTAFVADESGAVVGAPESALPPQMWGPLRGSHGIGLHHLRGRRYLTAPVGDRAGLGRWIVVAGSPDALPDQLARQALLAGERLVRLIGRARPPRPTEARAVRSELAEQLLGFRPAPERRLLLGRLAALELDVDTGVQVALLRWSSQTAPREARSQQSASIFAEIEAALSKLAIRFLLTHRDTDVILIAPQPLEQTLRSVFPALPGNTMPIICGLGRVVSTLDLLPRSLLDAGFAVKQLEERRRDTGGAGWVLLPHGDLDLATALICDADPELIAARQADLLGRITGHQLRPTLLAYLEHDLDIVRTAKSLHLHANSLRYRLTRIEEQLGMSLRRPSTIANIYLALLAERASATDGSSSAPGPGSYGPSANRCGS